MPPLLRALFVALFLSTPLLAEEKGLTAKVERTDGTLAEGPLKSVTLRLETDYGVVVLILSRAKTIDVMAEEGHQLALIELKNGHHLHGKILDDTLELDGTPAIPVASIREVKIIHPPDLSLFAIIFGLVTLTLMEIVLGVDNIIFLAIVAGRLPKEQQRSARRVGLVAALGTRLLLLFALSWILGLTKPVFKLPIPGMSPDAAEVSWRDIILLLGGAFLIFKSVRELHHKVEETRSGGGASKKERKPAGFVKTILLIAVIDIVFSLDSVITAVGMVDVLWVMVAAMVLAMGVMLFFAEAVSKFVDTYPTVKVLALSFLILIGVLLVAEGLGQHLNKGYVYFAMAFAVGIEVINMGLRPKNFADAIADGVSMIWRNGEFLEDSHAVLSWTDPGFVRGATVVDNCRTWNRKLFRWSDHLARFRRDCQACHVPLEPFDFELTAAAERLVADATQDVHIVMFATPVTVGLHLMPVPTERNARLYADGARLVVAGAAAASELQPAVAKHRSRMQWHVAEVKARAVHPDAFAVLTDAATGSLLETAIGNLLAFRDTYVVVPPAVCVLPGIGMNVVREFCVWRDLEVVEDIISMEDLRSGAVTGLTMVGSGFGVCRVAQIDDLVIPWENQRLEIMQDWTDKTGVELK